MGRRPVGLGRGWRRALPPLAVLSPDAGDAAATGQRDPGGREARTVHNGGREARTVHNGGRDHACRQGLLPDALVETFR
ncbi:hypothetical protein ACIQRK_28625 [Streptomyces anulatus]